jgi:hypothetical protein
LPEDHMRPSCPSRDGQDKVIGAINVQHRKPHSHGPAEIKLSLSSASKWEAPSKMPGCEETRGLSRSESLARQRDGFV